MSGQVALITGASQGLGLEVARAYARRGLGLILTARGATALQRAAAELAATTEVVALAGDVGDAAHAERLVAAGLTQVRPDRRADQQRLGARADARCRRSKSCPSTA